MENVEKSDAPCAQLRARCKLIENPEWVTCLSKIDAAAIDIPGLIAKYESTVNNSDGIILHAFVIFLKDDRDKFIHESTKLHALMPSEEQGAFVREVSAVLRIINPLIEKANKALLSSDYTKDAKWITTAEGKLVWVQTNL